MNIKSLISYLEEYPQDTEIKIIVNDTEEDVRCMIHNKEKGTIYLADSSYSCQRNTPIKGVFFVYRQLHIVI